MRTANAIALAAPLKPGCRPREFPVDNHANEPKRYAAARAAVPLPDVVLAKAIGPSPTRKQSWPFMFRIGDELAARTHFQDLDLGKLRGLGIEAVESKLESAG